MKNDATTATLLSDAELVQVQGGRLYGEDPIQKAKRLGEALIKKVKDFFDWF